MAAMRGRIARRQDISSIEGDCEPETSEMDGSDAPEMSRRHRADSHDSHTPHATPWSIDLSASGVRVQIDWKKGRYVYEREVHGRGYSLGLSKAKTKKATGIQHIKETDTSCIFFPYALLPNACAESVYGYELPPGALSKPWLS